MTGEARDDLVFNDQRGGVLRNSDWRARVFCPAVARCRDADLSDEELDEVADRLNDAIHVTADALRTAQIP
jgi:hypothetical protein